MKETVQGQKCQHSGWEIHQKILFSVLNEEIIFSLNLLKLQVCIGQVGRQRLDRIGKVLHYLIDLKNVPDILLNIVDKGKCFVETTLVVRNVVNIKLEPINSNVYHLKNIKFK